MNPDAFEAGQRAREWFHGLRIPPGMWTVVRVDGRSFSALTAKRSYEKPFDPAFRDVMAAVARHLLSDFRGAYAYTESDEASLLLPPTFDLFDSSVEKVVSLAAAGASGVASIELGEPVQYDARIWVGAGVADVVDYFSWRAADAARCALNGWCFWTLRKEGMSARAADGKLRSTTVAERNELLFERGINFNDLPAWQRRGVGLWWEQYEKVGHNPKTGQDVTATRQRVHVEDELPKGDGYRALIEGLACQVAQEAA